jgi:hypothetical protein
MTNQNAPFDQLLSLIKINQHFNDAVYIFEDSMDERNRSNVVELLVRFKDYATGAFFQGIMKNIDKRMKIREAF